MPLANRVLDVYIEMAKVRRQDQRRRAGARRFFAGAALALAAATLSAATLGLGPAAAELTAEQNPASSPVPAGDATPEQLRMFGYQLHAIGDFAGATAVAEALLQRDAKDAAALMLRAQAAQGLGNHARARQDARLVWRQAQTKDTRFASALMVAQSLAVDGYLNRSQLWLRLAAKDATDQAGLALVADEYKRVRSANPLIVNLQFSVSPSSNVNSGSTADYFRLPIGPDMSLELPLGGAQKALSGYEARLATQLTWRLAPTAQTMTAFHLAAEHRAVMLSSESKLAAPEVTGSDFNYDNLQLGVTQRYRPLEGETVYSFGAWLGHDRQGGAALSNTLRLTAQVERPLSARSLGFVGLSAERSHRLDTATRSSDAIGLNFGARFNLPQRDRLTLIFGLGKTYSDSAGNRGDRMSLRMGWEKSQPVLGVGLEAWLTVEARDYPDSPYDPTDGRQDLRTALNLVMSLDKVQYMGFTPTVDLVASRNRSDVALFDSRDLGLQFGFRSAF